MNISTTDGSLRRRLHFYDYASAFTLPDEMVEALKESKKLEADLAQVRGLRLAATTSGAEAGAASLEEQIEARGHEMSELYWMTKARDELRRNLISRIDGTAANLAGLVSSLKLPLIRDHMAPALEETLDAGRRALDGLEGVDLSAGSIIVTGTQAGKSWGAFTEAHGRYESIRAAQSLLADHGQQPERDHDNKFLAWRNGPDVWRVAYTGMIKTILPEDPVARFVFIVTHPEEAIAWCPTPMEQDTAYADYMEKRKERGREARDRGPAGEHFYQPAVPRP